jgi:hypothetical protein
LLQWLPTHGSFILPFIFVCGRCGACSQDIEFTVENKELFILQTRTAKRTARAGVSIAVDMVKERLISEREALLRIDAGQMDFYLHAMIEKEFGAYCTCCCLSSPPGPVCLCACVPVCLSMMLWRLHLRSGPS